MFIQMDIVKSQTVSDGDFQVWSAPDDSASAVPKDCPLHAPCFSLRWPVLAHRAGGKQWTAT